MSRPAHSDPSFACYSFALCVGRDVVERSTRVTRTSSKPPDMPGGSFVDIGLRVVVQQAPGTLIAFQSDRHHGTTRLFGARNCLISINFSSHIREAYEMAMAGTVIESSSGEYNEEEGEGEEKVEMGE